jgi:hypothetical protein
VASTVQNVNKLTSVASWVSWETQEATDANLLTFTKETFQILPPCSSTSPPASFTSPAPSIHPAAVHVNSGRRNGLAPGIEPV